MSQEKINEYLSVLDLPKEEQVKRLSKLYLRDSNGDLIFYPVEKIEQRRFLAELAFRKMNECDKNIFIEAVSIVQSEYETSPLRQLQILLEDPMGIIITALIAEELTKEKI